MVVSEPRESEECPMNEGSRLCASRGPDGGTVVVPGPSLLPGSPGSKVAGWIRERRSSLARALNRAPIDTCGSVDVARRA